MYVLAKYESCHFSPTMAKLSTQAMNQWDRNVLTSCTILVTLG